MYRFFISGLEVGGDNLQLYAKKSSEVDWLFRYRVRVTEIFLKITLNPQKPSQTKSKRKEIVTIVIA